MLTKGHGGFIETFLRNADASGFDDISISYYGLYNDQMCGTTNIIKLAYYINQITLKIQ